MHTVFPRVEAAATINLTCSSTAAVIRGRLQFEGGYYYHARNKSARSTRAQALNKSLHHRTSTQIKKNAMNKIKRGY